MRFGDRLSLDVTVAPGTRTALVPSMMLQPLVENALQHGIDARPGPGGVRISATREGAQLVLAVEDTGPGFDASARPRPGGGIGLSNLAARLEQLYGASHTLERGNVDGDAGGAYVRFRLPYHEGSS